MERKMVSEAIDCETFERALLLHCTEFIVQRRAVLQAELRDRLALHVDSVLVLGNQSLTHVHLYTGDVGQALQIAAHGNHQVERILVGGDLRCSP